MLGFQIVERHGAADFDAGARWGSDRSGQVGQADFHVRSEDDASFDGIAKLAQVARPAMACDGRTRLVRESGDGLAALPGEETKQVFGKGKYILPPLPQWGNGYFDYVQPVEQILAKCARGRLRFEVAVGCGQDADVPARVRVSPTRS